MKYNEVIYKHDVYFHAMMCCCSYINSHNQVRGHRTGSSHSGAEEYPGERTQTNQRWYTNISQLTQFMPPLETYKSEIGSQPTMGQVHTGAYVSLLACASTHWLSPPLAPAWMCQNVPIFSNYGIAPLVITLLCYLGACATCSKSYPWYSYHPLDITPP